MFDMFEKDLFGEDTQGFIKSVVSGIKSGLTN